MTKSDKKHWIVALIYGVLLCLSLFAFLKNPHCKIAGIAQILGPTIGTIVLAGFMMVQMAGKRISLACGIGAIAFLVVISFICMALTIPIMMGI